MAPRIRVTSLTNRVKHNSDFAAMKCGAERAALSISTHVAEGFERLTNSELLSFLAIARCSGGVVRSLIIVTKHRAQDGRHALVKPRPHGEGLHWSPSG